MLSEWVAAQANASGVDPTLMISVAKCTLIEMALVIISFFVLMWFGNNFKKYEFTKKNAKGIVGAYCVSMILLMIGVALGTIITTFGG